MLQSINDDPTLPDTEITLEFSAHAHRIFGSAGCNHYEGPYELRGHELDIFEIAIEERDCSSEDLMSQEQQYEDLLWEVTTYEMEDNSLLLKTDAGDTLLFTSLP